jgi:hypothetical protein
VIILSKVFEITGKLIVPDDLTHQELIDELYKRLQDIHFAGVTKEIKDK